jgi:hypothetical protein
VSSFNKFDFSQWKIGVLHSGAMPAEGGAAHVSRGAARFILVGFQQILFNTPSFGLVVLNLVLAAAS